MRIVRHLLLAAAAACSRPTATPVPASFDVEVTTTRGAFVIEVHREWAPLGAERLYTLVQEHFFDDSRAYRIRAGFIAQFGIAGDARVASAWRYRTMRDDSVRTSNVRGTVAFAMTGPNTRTTQIYVNLADNGRLDAQGFAPIGRVVRGMAVVDSLYAGYDESSGGGMRTGKQDSMFLQGNAWLDRNFPKLDRILRARILGSASPTLTPTKLP